MLRPQSRPYLPRYGRSLRPCLATPIIRLATGDHPEMSSGELPTDEELRDALDRVAVADVLVQALGAAVSLGFRRVASETQDLPQARLAIEALRALEPVLREGGVEEQLVRDLEQARTNLQLAYAKAVEEQNAG